MLLVQHPAVTSLACDPDEAFAIRPRRIDLMPYERSWRVTNMEARASQPLRHLGFLFVSRGARPQPLIERADLPQRRRAKRHVRAEDATHFDYLITVIRDRQIEVRRQRSRLRDWILRRQDTALHRRELGMRREEFFHCRHVSIRHREVVVEARDYLPARDCDRPILHPALAGLRLVKMYYLRVGVDRRPFNRGRRGRPVLRDQYLVIAAAALRGEAGE